MDKKVAALAATTAQIPRAPTDPGVSAGRSVVASQDAADLRLVIEPSDVPGAYIYKTIDRSTGEVVSQFPREQVVRMHQEADYAAGDVIRTRA